MSLDIAPLPVEGTEDIALPSRDVFCFHSNAAMPGFGISVYLFELSVNCTSLRQSGKRTQDIGLLATCAEKGREDSLQHSLATYRRRLSRTLAAWRMTALIATTTDTMTTRITSRAAIMEPKNRAASTSPITADAINSAASPALSCQNRRGGGERISCASGFRSGDRMIWKRVMVAPLPAYSRQLPFCSSLRPGESGSAAQASPDEYFKAIIAPIAVPLPWRGVRVFARASQMRKSRLLTTVQVFPTRQTVQLRNGVP